MDNLISKNYQQMISIPGSQNNELNKFFEMIDNLNKPIEFNQSKFNLNVRDENGNSILHRIIINSLNEQELLLKIEFIPKIETLINTVNFKQQTPLHLLCKYQYYESYLLLKKTLEGSEIDYLKEEISEEFEYEDLISLLEKDKNNLDEAIKTTKLPKTVNKDEINQLLIDLRTKFYNSKHGK